MPGVWEALTEAEAADRQMAKTVDDERTALRVLDQAQSARQRHAERLAELAATDRDAAEQMADVEHKLASSRAALADFVDLGEGCARVEAAQARVREARAAHQSSFARLSAHSQGLAVLRGPASARRADIAGWRGIGEAVRRLAT